MYGFIHSTLQRLRGCVTVNDNNYWIPRHEFCLDTFMECDVLLNTFMCNVRLNSVLEPIKSILE